MGSSQSKVSVAIPNKTLCFPSFTEESLQDTIEKIGECHLQAVQLASWIGSLTHPTGTTGHLVFSAATILFTFLLHRVSPAGSVGFDKCGSDIVSPRENGSYGSDTSDSVSTIGEEKTLEDALIEAKVSTAIANKSASELQAKISVVRNRYERMYNLGISRNEKRLEVVPAVQTCEEVLRLFQDPMHVFQTHPLITAPLLATFAAIFVSVAEISIALIPSYKEPLCKEINLLIETLQVYKKACIKARTESMKLKFIQPSTMLEAVARGMSEVNYRIEDTILASARGAQGGNQERIYEDPAVALSCYRQELENEYEKYFASVLDTTLKFSGFFHDAPELNSSSSSSNSSEEEEGEDDDDDDTIVSG